MTTHQVKFRDKSDARPLPAVPDFLHDEAERIFSIDVNRQDLNLFQKLEIVYGLIERFNEFVATFAVCQKGCNHCCKIDVSVSRLEAEYISVNADATIDFGDKKTFSHNSSCTFLGDDGACKVYNFRPFNCRAFHTLDDPKYCADGSAHQVYGAAGLGYGVGIYQSAAAWLAHVHSYRKLNSRDIRDWFVKG